MSLELPTLRIGLAGFTVEQQERLRLVLPQAYPSGITWEFGKFNEADVVWFNGARCQLLGDGTLRVAPAVAGGRSLHVRLPEVDRPVAFAAPVPRALESAISFDASSVWGIGRLLEQLEAVLHPLIVQFCLASQILEQESALGSGMYHVSSGQGRLLAHVNLRGDIGVLPSASPLELESAMWTPLLRDVEIPDHFTRTSLSRLMWQYALRSKRDVLPKRYRTDVLYFRRPPRLPQKALRDSHLLLLRELAVEPGRFADLMQRTGIVEPQMSHDLGALYLVGAITSNPKRAAQLPARRWSENSDSLRSASSVMPSGLGQESAPQPMMRPRGGDLTAPAPLSFD